MRQQLERLSWPPGAGLRHVLRPPAYDHMVSHITAAQLTAHAPSALTRRGSTVGVATCVS